MKPSNKVAVRVELKSTKMKKLIYVIKRPGLDLFLNEMSSVYNICIYTAHKSKVGNYCITALIFFFKDAEEIVNAVGITPFVFKVLSRNDCTKISRGIYMKSLMNLGFSLSETIFIDVSSIEILESSPLISNKSIL